MKKLELSPLQLDKETIALLSAKQLNDIVGRANKIAAPCGSGSSTAPPSTGPSCNCIPGASTCGVKHDFSMSLGF